MLSLIVNHWLPLETRSRIIGSYVSSFSLLKDLEKLIEHNYFVWIISSVHVFLGAWTSASGSIKDK